MPERPSCPDCGTQLPLDRPDGPCPACLLRLSLEADDGFAATVPLETPESIGPYRILQQIGEGGMGDVYLAEQRAPIRRRVALKVIKLGMDTRQVISRFESERQVLALLNHPNIAKVLDAGEHEGRPYFVMEYVAGVPVTDYCDRHRLDTRERLRLFAQICAAIQHAHQKGVIHRDIKPGNVLVALQDGKPVPKVIDFGVAKAADQRLAEQTVFTQHGMLIGTPEYMSPEQAEMTGLDVDTRTDIYSLGVLLYELLVGALPFDAETLKRAGFDEIRRIIREDAPTKLTTRLSGLGESAPKVAERRRTSLKSLGRQIRGDLEWITLKALEKDRTRRYPTASELAADIERHLNDHPVMAGPPSRSYRLAKFVRKNKVPVAAVVTVVLTLVVSGSVSLWFGWQNQQQGRMLQASAIFAAASNADDPLTQLLLLQELEGLPEPAGASELARQILGQPVPVAVYRGHDAPVSHVDMSADGERFVSASEDGSIRIWDVDSLRDEVVLRSDSPDSTPGFSFVSPGQDYVSSVWPSEGIVRVYPLNGGAPIVFNVTEPNVPDLFNTGETFTPEVAFVSPDGSYIATAGSGAPGGSLRTLIAALSASYMNVFGDSRVRFRSSAEPEEVFDFPETAASFDFSPAGRDIVFGHDDGSVEIRPDLAASPRVVFRAHAGEVTSVAYDSTGARLITASVDDGAVRIWRTDGSLVRTAVRASTTNGAASAKFSPDGQYFLVTRLLADAAPSDTIASGLLQLGQVEPHEYNAYAFQPGDNGSFNSPGGLVTLSGSYAFFSPDGRRLMSVGRNEIRIYEIDGQQVVQRGRIGNLGVDLLDLDYLATNVRYTERGAYLSVSDDQTVRIYLVAQGDSVRSTANVFDPDAGIDLPVTWPGLLSELRSRTTACLSPDQRMLYLAESGDAAQRGFGDCEVAQGREP